MGPGGGGSWLGNNFANTHIRRVHSHKLKQNRIQLRPNYVRFCGGWQGGSGGCREKRKNIEKLMYKYIKYKLLYNKDDREMFGRVDGAATVG